jgi:CubicO group peptidase (beta-lactamase class C family)
MRENTPRFITTALVSIVLAGGLAGQAAAAGFKLDAAAEKKVDAEAQRYIDEHISAGVAIGIMSEGKIIYAKGFGLANLETGTKVTPDSVFQLGSMTKQFTAAAVVLLSEQGKLGIDDPLSKYFPDFPRANEVTIRELLNHTSGIHSILMPGAPPTAEQAVNVHSTADVIALIQGQQNLYEFEPGTSRRYSNSGYFLLGGIVEKVSGVPFGDFLQQNIFSRAGMTATALDKQTEVVPHRASGYDHVPGSDIYTHPTLANDIGGGGAGGVRSTVGDMLRWQDALLAGRVVSAAGVKAMTAVGVLKNGQPALGPRYGFGLQVGQDNGQESVYHGGGGPGFAGEFKFYPNDHVAYVVLINVGAPQGPPPSGPNPGPPAAASNAGPSASTPRRMQAPPAIALSRFLTETITGVPSPGSR